MCGLYGVSSSFLSEKEKEQLYFLGLITSKRGLDSSGMMVSHREDGTNYVTVTRSVSPAAKFLHTKKVCELLNRKTVNAVVGHCRAATIGDVNLANSHPFCQGNIWGCHNGSIHEFKSKIEKLPPPESAEKGELHNQITDSQYLFHLINTLGIEEALTKVDAGAYAITYIDMSDSNIYFIRNDKRPLKFVRTNGAVFWSSEETFIESAVSPYSKIENIEPGYLYSMALGTCSMKQGAKIVEKRVYKPQERPDGWWSYRNIASQVTPKKNTVGPKIQPKLDELDIDSNELNKLVVAYGQFLRRQSNLSRKKKRYHNKMLLALLLNIQNDIRSLPVGAHARMSPTTGFYIIFDDKKKITGFQSSYSADKSVSKDPKDFSFTLLYKTTTSMVEAYFEHGDKEEKKETKYKIYNGVVKTKEQVEKLLDEGCSWCASPCSVNDEVYFIAQNDYVCNSCKENLIMEGVMNVYQCEKMEQVND